MPRILVVDDEPSVRDSVRRMLERRQHEVDEAVGVDTALARLEGGDVDLLLTDIRLGTGGTGIDLIAQARRRFPALRIVAMTAFGSVNVAVDAMRSGADDFLEKPFRVDAVLARLDRVLEPAKLAGEVARLRLENETLREQLELPEEGGDKRGGLVGSSPAMQRVRELIARVAPTDASVLIRGESGTGKELAARAIHQQSRRAGAPFVACNGSALAEGVLESELFGHEKGAFTGAERRRLGRFELANGGSLFLDEVGDLAPAVQVKLLRVLQERSIERVGSSAAIKVDVRVIAATNRDLQTAIRERMFREDLYYRLNVVTISLPPLRERTEDIPGLARLFLARYTGTASNNTREPVTIELTDRAIAALTAYSWPGNVRQLENVVHRGAVLARGGLIDAEDVELELESTESSPSSSDLRSVLAAVERDLLVRAVRDHQGNLTAAGAALGIDRNLLRYKLRKYGLRT